jgi:hypothetical protein
MQVSISRSAAVHIVIAAVVAFLAVVLPQVADLVGNGFQASDLTAANALFGAGFAAAIRAVILFVPASQ